MSSLPLSPFSMPQLQQSCEPWPSPSCKLSSREDPLPQTYWCFSLWKEVMHCSKVHRARLCCWLRFLFLNCSFIFLLFFAVWPYLLLKESGLTEYLMPACFQEVSLELCFTSNYYSWKLLVLKTEETKIFLPNEKCISCCQYISSITAIPSQLLYQSVSVRLDRYKGDLFWWYSIFNIHWCT